MTNEKVSSPWLRFVYLLCFYISLGFPWNAQSGSIFGVRIAGFGIEPHLILILAIMWPMYLLSGCNLQSTAMRRSLLVCRLITIICAMYFFVSIFVSAQKYAGLEAINRPMRDVKTWLLLWMMPVTVLYIHECGVDKWLRHFFYATACYCVLALIALRTPYGWGANFVDHNAVNIYGRITMENDILLMLAIPLAVAWLQDRGFSPIITICLGLYMLKLAMGMGRTLMVISIFFTLIIIFRGGRIGRSILTMAAIGLALLLVFAILPDAQKVGLTGRLTGLAERSRNYGDMLIRQNATAMKAMDKSSTSFLMGAGFGATLELAAAGRMYVDNLWVTLLFKMGLIGLCLVGGSILWFCWTLARGSPVSSVDRMFRLWAFYLPFICLRGSFMLWNTTSGIVWSTLAVAAIFADERKSLRLYGGYADEEECIDEGEYISEEAYAAV